jgi:hypothetical protein
VPQVPVFSLYIPFSHFILFQENCGTVRHPRGKRP